VPPYKAEGIVLKKLEYGENGEIVTLLTREHGKIRVFARGIRSLKGSLAGKLELLTTIRALISTGRSLDACTQVQVISSRLPLRNELGRMAYGLYFIELFERVLQFADRQENLFSLLQTSLDELCADRVRKERLALHLLYRFLSLLGYEPLVNHCACGQGRGKPLFFSASMGGIVCGECGAGDGRLFPLSGDELVLMKLLSSPDFLQREGIGEETAFSVRKKLEEHMSYHFSKRIKASLFIQRLRGASFRSLHSRA